MSEQQKRQLEQQLWNIANILRGRMSADDFRDYMLGFIFYKYLSDKIEQFADPLIATDKTLQPLNLKGYRDLKADAPGYEALIKALGKETLEQYGYFLAPPDLFGALVARALVLREDGTYAFIIDDLERILKSITESTLGTPSEEDFDNLFEDIDLSSSKLGRSPEQRNQLIVEVLRHIGEIDFLLEAGEADVLGDAYEYLIGQFASGAGKKAGEFYTPAAVSKVLAKIVCTGKRRIRSVYDPTCGSGSLLLRVARELDELPDFFGQELNRTVYNLARMNMIMHGVSYRHFDIKQEDTLTRPQHGDLRAEAIVANPPFSAKWHPGPLLMSDERFSPYGRLAPASKADFAFVLHMLHHLAEHGCMAVVLPHGALFRGGAEQHIRQHLIEQLNYLDAVIGLPANIFYGTSIPTCIMVFKKCREHPGDVLFIEASRDFEKVKTQNILREADIERIVGCYRARAELDRYSRRVPLAELAANDYNLNIPRYIDTFEAETPIDLDAVAAQLRQSGAELERNAAALRQFCDALGIATPY